MILAYTLTPCRFAVAPALHSTPYLCWRSRILFLNLVFKVSSMVNSANETTGSQRKQRLRALISYLRRNVQYNHPHYTLCQLAILFIYCCECRLFWYKKKQKKYITIIFVRFQISTTHSNRKQMLTFLIQSSRQDTGKKLYLEPFVRLNSHVLVSVTFSVAILRV